MKVYRSFAAIEGPYDLILMDPPWKYEDKGHHTNNASVHYETMDVKSMVSAFPIRDILARRGALFMWATCPRLHDAIDLISAYGLHYRGIPWVWVKTCKSDPSRPIRSGVIPTFTKPQVEMILAATTCKAGRPWGIKTLKMEQVVLHPRGRHSAKPAVFHKHIDDLCDAPRRLEMFARQKVDGWDLFGNDKSL